MAPQILIIKTGTTIQSLLQQGQDFECWFRSGMGLAASNAPVCNLYQGEPLPALENIDGIVITGSPAYVTDLAPWNQVGADYLRAAHDCGIPILGVCYGHQLLAWGFGGTVDFHPGGREIGTVPIELTAAAAQDPLFAGLPSRFKAQVSHLQSVIERPQQAVLLAGNDFEVNHAFRLGETTWCVQFHPEFSAEITRAYIRQRAVDIAKEGLDPDKLLEATEETETASSLLLRFVDIVQYRKAGDQSPPTSANSSSTTS